MPKTAVAHHGSALGEAVGKLIEQNLALSVQQVARPFQCSVRSSSLKNHMDNKHQIDIIVSDSQQRPVVLIEPKFLRYTKHNWDKGSRLCIAHHSLRRTYPSIQKSIAVLAGNWTRASLDFIQSFGVEIHRVLFDHVADVMASYGVGFRWGEKDKDASEDAWRVYGALSLDAKHEIAAALTAPVQSAVMQSVEQTLRADPSAPKRIASVELSLRTTDGEYLVYGYANVQDAIQRLLAFTKNVDDVRKMMK
jgi:hypothetical protein